MSSFLDTIPALIGVIVGIVATSWADKARWSRLQAIRWDERRVDAYAEYAKAIKRTHYTALRIVRPDRSDNLTKPLDRQTALEMLTQAEDQRTEAWELILLLADTATAHAGLRWHAAVRREAEFARSRPRDAESDDWIALVKDVDRARDLFYEAARHNLSVGGGRVAFAELRQNLQADSFQAPVPSE